MTAISRSKLNIFLVLGLIILAVSIILLASVPPISRDALTHHLFVPKLYIKNGGIYEIPNIPFSYYPMNLDLLYMIPLYFGNDIIPKYIHLFFALLTTLIVHGYLKKRTNHGYALLGSLFFLSIPIIVKLSITAYVDLGLMFFTTASLLLLFRWLNSGYSFRYLFLAGICCGLAAGTKYNGLISLFLLPLFIPVLYIRSIKNQVNGTSRKALGYSMLFVFAALLAFSPWIVRNYSWTGNPIYPLYNSFFEELSYKTIFEEQPGIKSLSDRIEQTPSESNSVFVSRKLLYNETGWQALLLPVRFFFEGQDDNPQYFDGKLNPFLLILPFFAFLRKSSTHSQQIEKHTWLAFAVFFFFFTFFQEVLRIRYIVCIIPPLVILSIFGLQNIFWAFSLKLSKLKSWVPMVINVAIASAMLSYNTEYIFHQFQKTQPFSYLQGTISRDQYISQFRPEYQIIQYANAYLKPGSTVLCLFLGYRGYYMNFEPLFERPNRDGLFSEITKSASDKDMVKNELLHRNLTHILIRNDLTQNWYQSLNETEQALITSFFQSNTQKLSSIEGYSFFRIVHNKSF